MAVAQSTKKSASGSGITTDPITTQTSGSLFVVVACGGAGSISSTITDSKSNDYGTAAWGETNGSGQDIKVWYKANGVGGSGHTVTNTGVGDGTLYLIELTAMDTSSPVDQSAVNQDASNPYTTGSLTTTSAVQTIIATIGSSGGDYTVNNSFSIIQEETDSGLYWPSAVAVRDVTSTGTYGVSFTDASGTAASLIIFSLKAAAASFINFCPSHSEDMTDSGDM